MINWISGTIGLVRATKAGGLGSIRGWVILKSCVEGWLQGKVDVRSAAIDSPVVQHSRRKQPRDQRRKQAEMGAADHSWHSERSTETEYDTNRTKFLKMCFAKLLKHF